MTSYQALQVNRIQRTSTTYKESIDLIPCEYSARGLSQYLWQTRRQACRFWPSLVDSLLRGSFGLFMQPALFTCLLPWRLTQVSEAVQTLDIGSPVTLDPDAGDLTTLYQELLQVRRKLGQIPWLVYSRGGRGNSLKTGIHVECLLSR